MTSIHRTGRVAGVLLAAGMFVAACGSSSKTTTATTTGPATTTKAPTVAIRTTSLGSVVVDANGRTLYHFDKDTAGSGTSACNGNCAVTWPAAQVTGTPTAGAGVTGTVGTITRSDGTQQVTLDGRPLYHFSGDQAAGDTQGDGFGGIWHVTKVGAAATPPSTGAATTTGATTTIYRY